MKRAIIASTLVLLAVAAAPQAQATDRRVEMSFEDVLHSPEANEAGIDGSVHFYLAGARTPPIIRRLGEGIANKKTNAFGKDDDKSCQRAMLSALKTFQASAKAKGANAVVDLVSYYKKNEERNPASYSCYVGFLMTSVTMKGTYAQVK